LRALADNSAVIRPVPGRTPALGRRCAPTLTERSSVSAYPPRSAVTAPDTRRGEHVPRR
jgi:hypothetical protein